MMDYRETLQQLSSTPAPPMTGAVARALIATSLKATARAALLDGARRIGGYSAATTINNVRTRLQELAGRLPGDALQVEPVGLREDIRAAARRAIIEVHGQLEGRAFEAAAPGLLSDFADSLRELPGTLAGAAAAVSGAAAGVGWAVVKPFVLPLVIVGGAGLLLLVYVVPKVLPSLVALKA